MNESESGTSRDERDDDPSQKKPERIPAMQRLLDNPFLLLFIGVTMPAVLYLIWGIMEIVQIPIAQ